MKVKITFQLLATILLAIVSAAEAQQPPGKVPGIGILTSGSASDPRVIAYLDTLRQGLRDFGYIEGKNLVFESRYGEGKVERLAELADQLVRLKVDILLGCDGGAAQAAKKSSTTIAVVFTTGGKPITGGLVASLARQGASVTRKGHWITFTVVQSSMVTLPFATLNLEH
jgi:putative ABC transport system substrate-binding protein